MTDLRKAAEMALKYLENNSPETDALVQVGPHVWEHKGSLVIQALRQALAESANSTTNLVEPEASSQTEQEPVAWSDIVSDGGLDPRNAFDTAPPKKEWVGLSDEEIKTIWGSYFSRGLEFAKAIEAKLRERNGG